MQRVTGLGYFSLSKLSIETFSLKKTGFFSRDFRLPAQISISKETIRKHEGKTDTNERLIVDEKKTCM